jgi:hypothetical protein
MKRDRLLELLERRVRDAWEAVGTDRKKFGCHSFQYRERKEEWEEITTTLSQYLTKDYSPVLTSLKEVLADTTEDLIGVSAALDVFAEMAHEEGVGGDSDEEVRIQALYDRLSYIEGNLKVGIRRLKNRIRSKNCAKKKPPD